MDLFITIFAIIWFVLFTCVVFAKRKETIKLPWFIFISIVAAFSWIVKMVIECLS